MVRRSWLLLVIALAVMLVLVACGGDDDAATSDPAVVLTGDDQVTVAAEAATATTQPSAVTGAASPATDEASGLSDEAALEAVLAALDAKNSFDFDGWLAAFEGGQRRGIPLFAEEILMNAGERWEVVEPCQVRVSTTSDDTVVQCLIQEITGRYWGVGGISGTKVQTFAVNTDGLITNNNHFGSGRKNSFNQAFHQWLSDTYPDVYKEMGYGFISSNAPGFDTRNPEHMLIAVEYVEEFVAQSDVYPLDATTP